MARRQQARSVELRAAASLSRLWRREGRLEDARRVLGAVYASFREGLDTADFRDARAALAALDSA